MTFEEVLDELGIPHKGSGEHHHTTQGFIQIDCPWCSKGDGRFRMGIPKNRPTFARCWTCGMHKLLDSLIESTGLGYNAVKTVLRGLTLLGEPEPVRGRRGPLKRPPGVGPLLPIHKKYLISRGLNISTVENLYGLKGIGLEGGHLAWRIYIPVHHREVEVSWTTRSIDPKSPKRYWSASPEEESMPLKDLLWGEDLAGNSIAVVEGPFDAMRIGPGAVATCGVVVTPAQKAKITRYPLRVICMDNSPDAQRVALNLCSELQAHPGRTINVVLDAADPGEASNKEIELFRKEFLD